MRTRMRKAMLGAMLAILLTGSFGYADLSTGLVGYWSFDDAGNLGCDYSGTGNHGSLVGAVTSTAGVSGGAVHLNGSAYISVPDHPTLDLSGGSGTISAHIKVDQSSDDWGIVAKESNSSVIGAIAYEFLLRGYGTYPTLAISDSISIEGGTPTPQPNLKDNQWHHIAVTWSGSGGQIRMYQDGVPVLQKTQTISTINNISAAVYIGTYRWQGGYRCGTGDIDEVRIYNRALSEPEIQQLARTTIAASIDIDPDTLDLSSKDKWVTCYIELPNGFDVIDIDGSTVTLEGIPAYIGEEGWARAGANTSNIMDHDGDGIRERMVKFYRSAVQEYVIGVGLTGYVELTVTGDLVGGPSFEGADVIRVTSGGN